MSVYRILIILFAALFNHNLYSHTTVISHGYNFPGYNPIRSWMTEMGEAICKRQGGGVIYLYDGPSGECQKVKTVGKAGKGSVILFDWTEDSNDPEEGHSEAAGNALFCALIQGEKDKFLDLGHLHFIGHSRGCVVNSEAVERLLVMGYPVDQMTFLDAHDWGLNVTHEDFYVNPPELESGIEAWKGVGWADAYWHDANVGLSGRPVNGAYSLQLNVKRHFQVYKWYMKTIKNEDSKAGYFWSDMGGGKMNRPQPEGSPYEPYYQFVEEGVVNGSFDWEPPLSRRIAGWAHHGGGGFGHIKEGQLELDLGNHLKTHDRVYVHNTVNDLVFDLKCTNADGSGNPEVDQFIVSINETEVCRKPLNQIDEEFETYRLSMLPYQGEIITFTLEILDERAGKTFINSEVKIDNVRFE